MQCERRRLSVWIYFFRHSYTFRFVFIMQWKRSGCVYILVFSETIYFALKSSSLIFCVNKTPLTVLPEQTLKSSIFLTPPIPLWQLKKTLLDCNKISFVLKKILLKVLPAIRIQWIKNTHRPHVWWSGGYFLQVCLYFRCKLTSGFHM